jgi:CRP/FNR family transcriptional regulator, cyclic AMP receptor protein
MLPRTTRQAVLDTVRSIPLFSGCNTRELREVARLGTPVRVAAGTTLAEQGTSGRELLIVLSGTATCRAKGKRLARFGPGDFFGEISLIDRGPRSATVVADSDMQLLALDSREFRRLVLTSPSIAWKILETMAGRLRVADNALSN